MMNGRTILLLLTGLFGLLGQPVVGFADEHSWDAHMAAGNQFAAQGNYEGAESRYVEAIAAANVSAYEGARELRETTVQIMGRSCEYDAAEIEQAVWRLAGIEEIKFIHEKGRVLIRYQAEKVSPEQLVEAVERAMVMGWNCHAQLARSS